MQLDLFCPIFGREAVYTRLCNELSGDLTRCKALLLGRNKAAGAIPHILKFEDGNRICLNRKYSKNLSPIYLSIQYTISTLKSSVIWALRGLFLI